MSVASIEIWSSGMQLFSIFECWWCHFFLWYLTVFVETLKIIKNDCKYEHAWVTIITITDITIVHMICLYIIKTMFYIHIISVSCNIMPINNIYWQVLIHFFESQKRCCNAVIFAHINRNMTKFKWVFSSANTLLSY